MPSPTEKAEEQMARQMASLKLRQVLEVFKNRRRTTTEQLGWLLDTENNTACEPLRRLEKIGYLRRTRQGVYEATNRELSNSEG